MIDGSTLEHAYKYTWSDFTKWDQRMHAEGWVLLAQNLGQHLSIDETSLHDDLYTILTNKDGHGRQGTVIAMVRGTKAEDVINVLLQLPLEERQKVAEVTMDLSESMRSIVESVLPNARITLDCFHIMKRCLEAVEELRLRYRREAQADIRRAERRFKERLKRNAAHRKWYQHPKKYKGKKRGPKPKRRNEQFRPPVLENGDTEVYDIVNKLRAIFRSKKLSREETKTKLHEWYHTVAECTIREIKSARDAIKSREENILNYFIDRSTNASAESFNSKLKAFRAQIRGI